MKVRKTVKKYIRLTIRKIILLYKDLFEDFEKGIILESKSVCIHCGRRKGFTNGSGCEIFEMVSEQTRKASNLYLWGSTYCEYCRRF